MDFNEYQSLARRTQNNDLNAHAKELHALFGMCSEVGEIHSLYQKEFQGHNLNYDDVIDEMSDILWFMAELADVIGTSLDDVAKHNIEKLRKRYPGEGFDADRSVNRDKYAKNK